MKLRNDFVSNSSSSSFIVISKDRTNEAGDVSKIKDMFVENNESWSEYYFPNDDYKCEFGWEFEDTNSIKGKLNFIGLQLLYLLTIKMGESYPFYKNDADVEFNRCYNMVKKVCLEKFGFYVKLDTEKFIKVSFHNDSNGGYKVSFEVDSGFGYIDHQSNVYENKCMEMFESEDALYDFLRSSDSYIRGGNDNED